MNFHKNKNKGFTLLELLVVIALIGIFAAITAAALGASRKKGTDASLKSTLAGMRAQGELYYSNNARSYGTGVTVAYTGKCDTTTTTNLFGSTIVGTLKSAAVSANNDVGTSATSSCAQDTDSWAYAVTLTDSSSWCVDSVGVSKSGVIAASGATCQ